MAMDVEAGSVMVSFLHPHLPAPSFTFPEPPHMLDVDMSDIVSQVNPTTATGRTYTLTKQEMTEATGLHLSQTPSFIVFTPMLPLCFDSSLQFTFIPMNFEYTIKARTYSISMLQGLFRRSKVLKKNIKILLFLM